MGTCKGVCYGKNRVEIEEERKALMDAGMLVKNRENDSVKVKN